MGATKGPDRSGISRLLAMPPASLGYPAAWPGSWTALFGTEGTLRPQVRNELVTQVDNGAETLHDSGYHRSTVLLVVGREFAGGAKVQLLTSADKDLHRGVW